MPDPAVSVVIATRNRAALLAGALAQWLRAQAGIPSCELVVVDNGSTDGTAAVAREHGAICVSVPEPNRGLARNAGCRRGFGPRSCCSSTTTSSCRRSSSPPTCARTPPTRRRTS